MNELPNKHPIPPSDRRVPAVGAFGKVVIKVS